MAKVAKEAQTAKGPQGIAKGPQGIIGLGKDEPAALRLSGRATDCRGHRQGSGSSSGIPDREGYIEKKLL